VSINTLRCAVGWRMTFSHTMMSAGGQSCARVRLPLPPATEP
jgi:hypothetical protein